jgi:SepF-like predicted cell division protein (DUF552 family)
MAFIEKMLKKSKSEDVDIEDFLNNLDVSEEEMYDDADAYVKPIMLKADTDLKSIAKELKEGNIVLLNVSDLVKRSPVRLKEQLAKLKRFVTEIDGDIARISDEQVILTPTKIKIIKRKK